MGIFWRLSAAFVALWMIVSPAAAQIGPGPGVVNTYCSSTGGAPYVWLPCNPTGGGGGGGLSVTDQTPWVQGTSAFTPTGGVFNDTATLSSGQEGTARLTTKRALLVDTDTSGNALYAAVTAPVPYLIATNCITNTYTNGQTQPGNANLNGNACVFIGNTSIAVTGTFFQTTQPVSNAGTFAVQNTAATPAGTNTIGSVNSASNVTPTNCSGSITTGGTAQNAFTAQTTLHGFTVANIDTAHNDEVLWISFTTTAAALTAASYPLPAPTPTTFAGFGSFTSPTGFGTNIALSIIGATTGHVFSCTWW